MVQLDSPFASSGSCCACMRCRQRCLDQSHKWPHQCSIRPPSSGKYLVPFGHFSHRRHGCSHDDEFEIERTTFRYSPHPNIRGYNYPSHQNYLLHGASVFVHSPKPRSQYLGIPWLTAHPGLSSNINLHDLWTHFEAHSTTINRPGIRRGRSGRTHSDLPIQSEHLQSQHSSTGGHTSRKTEAAKDSWSNSHAD